MFKCGYLVGFDVLTNCRFATQTFLVCSGVHPTFSSKGLIYIKRKILFWYADTPTSRCEIFNLR